MLDLTVIDLGAVSYADAYAEQCACVERALAAREAERAIAGTILLVEHPAMITVSARAGAGAHVLAGPEVLAREGIALVETDRGGDVTYHGPGQLVVYPILDLNALGLRLHEYMRMLEAAVIRGIGSFGIVGERDVCATGVWVRGGKAIDVGGGACGEGTAKICAMGVRVRRWVSMHGLALNVTTNLEHFGLIVPCGLAGRTVTSMREELAELCPTMAAVKREMVESLRREIESAQEKNAARAHLPGSGMGC